MFDVNPKGPLMHLQEIERQAAAAADRAAGEDHGKVLAALRRWLMTAMSRRIARSEARSPLS